MEINLHVQRIRPYEGVVIMSPDSTDEDHKNLFKKNKSIIESFKGKMHNVDTWGRRKLTNPIHKERTGIYFHSTFMADPQCIAELERTMKINEKVLRYLHVRLDDRTDLDKHLQGFKDALADAHKREREREERGEAMAARRRERKPAIS